MKKMAIMNDCLVSGLAYQDTVGPQSPELRALRWAAERGMCQLTETHHPNRMVAVRAVFGNEEDLAFFQNLTAVRGKEGELAVHRLKLVRDRLPGEYRLRMLLVQGGQRAREFTGSYQLVATIVNGGQRSTLLFPQDASGNAQFQLAFKYYLRVEKSLQLPPGAEVESIQVRIFEQGVREPKLRQNVNLS